jgi:uncharacterized protein YbjT (DUF2867 family)
MSNTFQWLPQLRAGNVVRAAFPQAHAAVIDPANIAAVATVALTAAGHNEAVYEVSGPQALVPADRAPSRVARRWTRWQPR